MVLAPLPIRAPRAPGLDPSTGGDAASRAADVGALLLRVANSDARAFDDLYKQTSHRVYGLVSRVLVDAGMSAETTQDVFLALWVGGAERFDPALGSGMSWILTIAHRRAVDRVRAEESHRAREGRWASRNRDAEYDEVADTALRRVEADSVRERLETLSAVQRDAIHLAYYAGMTYVQVAEHLDIPVPTAKTRIRDGIQRLSRSMTISG
ncbi:sigma-70 family RNA polymerase sigma factor [Vibrio cholerae]|jgi:RNA polymerase sigma-70 factor (ECF subfamily)|nr:sigma-70 family RNA polymerase sigma factor [Vibrio cholerae]